MRYLPVLLNVILFSYSQIIVKYEVANLGPFRLDSFSSIMNYLFRVFTNIGMISAFLAVLFGAISWIYAMNKLELSSAYPLLSINFIIIPIMSYFLFDESLNAYKLIGIGIIILGLVVFSRGI